MAAARPPCSHGNKSCPEKHLERTARCHPPSKVPGVWDIKRHRLSLHRQEEALSWLWHVKGDLPLDHIHIESWFGVHNGVIISSMREGTNPPIHVISPKERKRPRLFHRLFPWTGSLSCLVSTTFFWEGANHQTCGCEAVNTTPCKAPDGTSSSSAAVATSRPVLSILRLAGQTKCTLEPVPPPSSRRQLLGTRFVACWRPKKQCRQKLVDTACWLPLYTDSTRRLRKSHALGALASSAPSTSPSAQKKRGASGGV